MSMKVPTIEKIAGQTILISKSRMERGETIS